MGLHLRSGSIRRPAIDFRHGKHVPSCIAITHAGGYSLRFRCVLIEPLGIVGDQSLSPFGERKPAPTVGETMVWLGLSKRADDVCLIIHSHLLQGTIL
jgi:hypothetical protein